MAEGRHSAPSQDVQPEAGKELTYDEVDGLDNLITAIRIMRKLGIKTKGCSALCDCKRQLRRHLQQTKQQTGESGIEFGQVRNRDIDAMWGQCWASVVDGGPNFQNSIYFCLCHFGNVKYRAYIGNNILKYLSHSLKCRDFLINIYFFHFRN